MYDVITIGSATRDVFMISKTLGDVKDKKFETGKAFCFDVGSKNEMDEVIFSTGGGATNAAATFASMGLKVACMSNIGDDPSGKASLEDLKSHGIDTSLINVSKKYGTGYSVLLSSSKVGGRIVLGYRGASSKFSEINFPNPKMKAKWFYISSLGGNITLLKKIVNFAHKNNIKVALNPGSKELAYGLDKLKPIISKLSVFNLNQEEAAKLTGLPFKSLNKIARKMSGLMTEGVGIITRGPEGLVTCENGKCYSCGILPGKVIERTGAGDSFGSGFVSGLMMKNSVEFAIQLGSANATSVIKEVGAKNGILKKKDIKSMPKIKVGQYKLIK